MRNGSQSPRNGKSKPCPAARYTGTPAGRRRSVLRSGRKSNRRCTSNSPPSGQARHASTSLKSARASRSRPSTGPPTSVIGIVSSSSAAAVGHQRQRKRLIGPTRHEQPPFANHAGICNRRRHSRQGQRRLHDAGPGLAVHGQGHRRLLQSGGTVDALFRADKFRAQTAIQPNQVVCLSAPKSQYPGGGDLLAIDSVSTDGTNLTLRRPYKDLGVGMPPGPAAGLDERHVQRS